MGYFVSNLSNLIGTNVPFTPTNNSTNASIAAIATDYTILSSSATRRFLMIQCLTGNLYVTYQGSTSYSVGNYLGQNIIAGDIMKFDVAVPNTAIQASSPVAGTTY